jgi:hypothetical protein
VLEITAKVLFSCLSIAPALAETSVCRAQDTGCIACEEVVRTGILNTVVIKSVEIGLLKVEATKLPLSEASTNRIVFPDVIARSSVGSFFPAHAECFFERGNPEPSWVTVQFRNTDTTGLIRLPQSRTKAPRQAFYYLNDKEYAALPPGETRFFALNNKEVSDILNSK